LGNDDEPEDLGVHTGWRRFSESAKCDELARHHGERPTRPLRAAISKPLVQFAGRKTATSYCDTSPLKETPLDLVDFSLISGRATRFAVAAVNVITGNFIYFDNAHEQIALGVTGSGALPPALPIVKIGTDYFWDGGIVSNTPLQHLLDADDRVYTLVFQVDLFSARGMLPRLPVVFVQVVDYPPFRE
jgi:predicted acylesterase/phospholipase RssA